MFSYCATTLRIRASVGFAASSRTVRSWASARVYISRAVSAADAEVAPATQERASSALMNGCFMEIRLSNLRIHFFEVILLHEHLARLPAGGRRHEAVHFHHVDKTRRAAEPDAQPSLQVRDRRLAARHHDARGFVVQLVLVELHVLLRRLLVCGDGGVV